MSNPTRLRIAGGTVYDPANAEDGVVRDVCIEGDRIVAELPAGAPRLDARGIVVMPGGVDIHVHVAGSSVDNCRRVLHDEDAPVPGTPPAVEAGAGVRAGCSDPVPNG